MFSHRTRVHTCVALSALSVAATATQAQQSASTQEVHNLAPVEVSATRETADGPVIGYRATRSATATRTDTPIEDVPRSISVISAEVMEDIGEERIDRALDFAGGVTRGNNFGGIDMTTTNVRGFDTGSQYRNGMASAGNNRGFRSAPDSANIERVEVLKGPASGLLGVASQAVSSMLSPKPHSLKNLCAEKSAPRGGIVTAAPWM